MKIKYRESERQHVCKVQHIYIVVLGFPGAVTFELLKNFATFHALFYRKQSKDLLYAPSTHERKPKEKLHTNTN